MKGMVALAMSTPTHDVQHQPRRTSLALQNLRVLLARVRLLGVLALSLRAGLELGPEKVACSRPRVLGSMCGADGARQIPHMPRLNEVLLLRFSVCCVLTTVQANIVDASFSRPPRVLALSCVWTLSFIRNSFGIRNNSAVPVQKQTRNNSAVQKQTLQTQSPARVRATACRPQMHRIAFR